MQSIILYWAANNPNAAKVLIILEELELPYFSNSVDGKTLGQQPLAEINPNERLPAIIDPNTGLTLWESGAIVEYLVDIYDIDGKISYHFRLERHLLRQWSYFQSSGQSPYFRQATWFKSFHIGRYGDRPETALTHFCLEIKRVCGVLNSVLEGRHWLVGDRCTYADLSFFMWNWYVIYITAGLDGHQSFDWNNFPNVKRWHDAMGQRPAVASVIARLLHKEVYKILCAKQG